MDKLHSAPKIPSKKAFLTFNRGGPSLWEKNGASLVTESLTIPPAISPFAKLRNRKDPLTVFASHPPKQLPGCYSTAWGNRIYRSIPPPPPCLSDVDPLFKRGRPPPRPQSLEEVDYPLNKGQPLKDTVADLLREGLAVPRSRAPCRTYNRSAGLKSTLPYVCWELSKAGLFS